MRTSILSASLALAVLGTGCAYHSQVDADGLRDVAPPSRATSMREIQVLPIRHSPSSGDASVGKAVLIVPLVPYVTTVVERGEPNHLPVGYLADQLRKSGLFRAVKVGTGQGGSASYVLEAAVTSSRVQERSTAYGLSVVGTVLQLFTALPSESRSAELEVSLELRDPQGKILLEQSYSVAKSRLGGVWMPLSGYGPQFTYGQHANLMARAAEEAVARGIADIRAALESEPSR